MGDLTPGELKQMGAPHWREGGDLREPYSFRNLSEHEIVTVVLMCSDVIGRRFRFGYVRPSHLPPTDPFLRPLPAEVSTVSEDHPEHVGWAAEPIVWG